MKMVRNEIMNQIGNTEGDIQNSALMISADIRNDIWYCVRNEINTPVQNKIWNATKKQIEGN